MISRILTAVLGVSLLLSLSACRDDQTLDGGLEVGKSYYIIVNALSVSPERPDGETWDPNDGAPDLTYTMYWQGVAVHESPVIEDSLTAHYDAVLSRYEGQSAILAPLIRIDGPDGNILRITVDDEDTLSQSDAIAQIEIALDDLSLGDNDIPVANSLVKEMIVRVVSADDEPADIRKELGAAIGH